MQYLIFLVSVVALARAATWDYDDAGAHGPSHWGGVCNKAGSVKQSPINIDTGKVKQKTMDDFKLKNYGAADCAMKNNGHSVAISVDTSVQMDMSLGGLGATYRLHSFHFHWGKTDSQGSEHTIDDKRYPVEAHFVHYNTKYADLTAAVAKSDGLAVLGFMFQVGSENKNYKDIINALGSVTSTDGTHPLQQLNVGDLLGDMDQFYRYSGSLTTPDCNESVTWTLFKKPLEMSSSQIAKFRDLLSAHGKIVDNFRPTQPLGSRTVYTNTNGASNVVSSLSLMLLAAAVSWFASHRLL